MVISHLVTWYTQFNWIAQLLKKPELVHKPFLATGIDGNLNGADDLMIQSETDIEMIFDNENDDENFHSFATKDLAAATPDINKLLMD